MPFIAGIIWKKEAASKAAMQFSSMLNDMSTHYKLIERPWCMLAASKEVQESPIEKIEILDAQRGLLVGRFFEKSTGKSISLDSTALTAIQKSPEYLGTHYWGRYTLALLDDSRETISLFREPQGGINLFVYPYREGLLFSSEIAFIHDFLEGELALDWQYLTSYIISAHTMTSLTPFHGVTEVLPGSCVALTQTGFSSSLFWNPAKFGLSHAKNKEEVLLAHLEQCIQAWTQDTEGPLGIELSGGLDSSSVCMLLKKVAKERQLIAYNCYHPKVASSDERIHAQKISLACGIALECIDLSKYSVIDKISLVRTNKPMGALDNEAYIESIDNLFQKHKIVDIFSGQGGDHLFMANPSSQLLVDYVLSQGFKGISGKLHDLGAFLRKPFLRIVGEALLSSTYYAIGNIQKELIFGYRPWMKATTFQHNINKELFKVPFWSDLLYHPPAKANHLSSLYEAVLYADQRQTSKGLQTINPLLSQPLVEFACSVPTYELFGDKYDRILFRKAMFSSTKNDYVWRKHKGEVSGVFVLTLQANFKLVSEFLMNGVYARKQMIDRDLLYEDLKAIRHGKIDDNLWSVIHLIAVEKWLHAWNKS